MPRGIADANTNFGRSAAAAPPDSGPASAALVPLLSDYLDDVATRTAERLGGVAGVAVTLKVEGEPMTVGASNALAAAVDSIQFEVGVGPCLYALREGVGLYVPDLATDHRWRDYGQRAASRGAASCVSVPVLVDGRPAAVYKVYGARLDGLSEAQRSVAHEVALDIAGGIALAKHLCQHARTIDDRESAMDTRRAIDLALGVLMERSGCNASQAFSMLRSQSQARNVKLRDVAKQVLATLPGVGDDDDKSPFRPPGAALR